MDVDGAVEMVARTPRRRWRTALLVLLAALGLTLLAGSVTTWAWASALRDDGRLLPGTHVAAVDVSALTVDEAREAVETALAEQLDRPLTVTHDEVSRTTTARELGAGTDLDEVLADAATRAADARFRELARVRWLGADPVGREVAVTLDEAAVATFVAEVAEQVERSAVDAAIAVDGETLQVEPAVDGQAVDRDAAAAALTAAAADPDADGPLPLPVTVTVPDLSTADAEAVVSATATAVDVVLDRAVTVTLGGETRRVTPRELDAEVDRAALVATGLDGDLPRADDVELTLSDAALRGVIDAVAAGQERAAKDAVLRYERGDFDVTPEQVGAAVDRGEAIGRLRQALGGADDTVDLELATVRPRITSGSFDRVLVLEQSERVVALYRDGERTHEWPVAVGAASSRTPTGQFTVGAKRFEPTWVNPAPTRWGRDMPARIGPGPDNPLGVRALNWNDAGGRDTLIRFHGTPNEDSIGSATSNGCVRMFNHDVIELYDLVPSGTVIVSLS